MPDTFSGSVPSPNVISGNRSTGWYLAIQDYSDFQRKILHWTGIDQEVEFITLPNEASLINFSWCFQGLVGNRFILGGAGNAYSPVTVIECDKTTGNKLSGFQFGDSKTGASYATPLTNGGLAGVAFQEVDSYRRVSCHAFYRKPIAPSIPSYSDWWTQRFDFNLPREGTGDSNLPGLNTAVVQGPDGRIYVFMVRDGLGEIWALAFDVMPDRLVPSQGFPRKIVGVGEGALSVQGEMPQIAAVCDKWNNSIVLSYQNDNGFPAPCGLHPNLSHHSIVEWKLGQSLNLLGETEFMDSHSNIGAIGIFSRPNGVYFALQQVNLQTCEATWNIGLCSGGKIDVLKTWGDSQIVSKSDDGWVFVYDRLAANTRIEKLRFKPQMRIKDSGNEVVLDWDESAVTDRLETSTNLKSWTLDGYAGLPPVTKSKEGSNRFWRVRTA